MSGHFQALVETWNGYGSKCSEKIDFYVGNQTYARLSTNKSTYAVDERVYFTIEADGIKNVLWIYCPNGDTLTYDDVGYSYDLGFGMSGHFQALVQTWNGVGSCISDRIDPDEWEAVQQELARRKSIGRSYSGVSPLGAKIRCGDCGGWYGVKVWHSTDKYRSVVWQYNSKFSEGKERCATLVLKGEDICARFISAYNSLITDKDVYLPVCETMKSVLADTGEIDTEMDELLREMEVIAGLTRKCVEENSLVAQDQAEYSARYNGYVDRYERAKARYDSLAELRREKQAKARAIDRFVATLAKRDGLLKEFDSRLRLIVLDYATVNRDKTVTFRFYDGTEVTR